MRRLSYASLGFVVNGRAVPSASDACKSGPRRSRAIAYEADKHAENAVRQNLEIVSR